MKHPSSSSRRNLDVVFALLPMSHCSLDRLHLLLLHNPILHAVRSPTFYDSTLSTGPAPTETPSGDDDGSLGAPRRNTTSPTSSSAPAAAASWGAPLGSPCSLDLSWGDGLVFCEPDLVREARPSELECKRRGATSRSLTKFENSSRNEQQTRYIPPLYHQNTICCLAGVQVCAPTTSGSGPSDREPMSDLDGVCARARQGAIMTTTFPTLWPTPLAYFP